MYNMRYFNDHMPCTYFRHGDCISAKDILYIVHCTISSILFVFLFRARITNELTLDNQWEDSQNRVIIALLSKNNSSREQYLASMNVLKFEIGRFIDLIPK